MPKISTIQLFFICLLLSQSTIFAQSIESIRKHIEYMASNALEGRLPCTIGDSLTANYIKKHFESKNVIPFKSEYYQQFNVNIGVEITAINQLSIDNTVLRLFDDFEPVSVSSEGNFKSEITAIPFDSLKNGSNFSEFSGKWIVVEMGNYTPSVREYMRWASKASKAKIQGILFIVSSLDNEKKNNPLSSSSIENQLIRTQYKGNNKLYTKNAKGNISKILFNRGIFHCPIPLLMVAQKPYYNIINSKPSKALLNSTIATTIQINTISGKTQNVIGYIKGTERPDEYIIIGAHYDHLGYGGYESGSREPESVKIHYGADDNASGTAVVLGLVSRFSKNPPPMSIIFASFGAEEMGLLGSQYMSQHLPVDEIAIKAMLNYDMVGRMVDSVLNIGGVGTANSFKEIIDTMTTTLQICTTPYGTGPSDHASFNSKKIPVLYFNTGVHSDYHTPEDIASKINYFGIMNVIDYTESLLKPLSMPHSDLTYIETEFEQVSHASRNSLKVSLGVIPDVTGGDNTGLIVMGVIAGGKADRSDIKNGDKIIEIDDTQIKNIYDYMEKLQQISPNDISHITIERNKEKRIVLIRF